MNFMIESVAFKASAMVIPVTRILMGFPVGGPSLSGKTLAVGVNPLSVYF